MSRLIIQYIIDNIITAEAIFQQAPPPGYEGWFSYKWRGLQLFLSDFRTADGVLR